MTRGALSFVHEKYPGAYLSHEIFYLSVAGMAVTSSATGNQIERFAWDSYPQVSGLANPQIGDGVVPFSNAMLDGSMQISIPNVYHSINAPQNFWYGSDDVVDYWLQSFVSGCDAMYKKRTDDNASFL